MFIKLHPRLPFGRKCSDCKTPNSYKIIRQTVVFNEREGMGCIDAVVECEICSAKRTLKWREKMVSDWRVRR